MKEVKEGKEKRPVQDNSNNSIPGSSHTRTSPSAQEIFDLLQSVHSFVALVEGEHMYVTQLEISKLFSF